MKSLGSKIVLFALVAYAIVYFGVGACIGPVTAATWDLLPNEAEYTVVGITKKLVPNGKISQDMYSVSVEYEVDGEMRQHESKLLMGENNIGDSGTLRYNDSTVILDREVDSHKSTSVGVLMSVVVIGAVAAYGTWRSDHD